MSVQRAAIPALMLPLFSRHRLQLLQALLYVLVDSAKDGDTLSTAAGGRSLMPSSAITYISRV